MPYESGNFLEAKPIVLGHLNDNGELSGEAETELLDELNNISNEDPGTRYGYDMSLNITDAISYFVEATIQSLIADGAANVLSKLGINQDTVEIA
jgi:hypothetical protein